MVAAHAATVVTHAAFTLQAGVAETTVALGIEDLLLLGREGRVEALGGVDALGHLRVALGPERLHLVQALRRGQLGPVFAGAGHGATGLRGCARHEGAPGGFLVRAELEFGFELGLVLGDAFLHAFQALGVALLGWLCAGRGGFDALRHVLGAHVAGHVTRCALGDGGGREADKGGGEGGGDEGAFREHFHDHS